MTETVIPLAIRHQMAMARPWEHAETDSLWEISGRYPASLPDGGTFTNCAAVVLPGDMAVMDGPQPRIVFALVSFDDDAPPILPEWISSARRLMIVLADDPTTAYREQDQAELDIRMKQGTEDPWA